MKLGEGSGSSCAARLKVTWALTGGAALERLTGARDHGVGGLFNLFDKCLTPVDPHSQPPIFSLAEPRPIISRAARHTIPAVQN